MSMWLSFLFFFLIIQGHVRVISAQFAISLCITESKTRTSRKHLVEFLLLLTLVPHLIKHSHCGTYSALGKTLSNRDSSCPSTSPLSCGRKPTKWAIQNRNLWSQSPQAKWTKFRTGRQSQEGMFLVQVTKKSMTQTAWICSPSHKNKSPFETWCSSCRCCCCCCLLRPSNNASYSLSISFLQTNFLERRQNSLWSRCTMG